MKSKFTFSLFCILFFIVPSEAFSQAPESVRISEVMFYGLSGNNEYVEIFNADFSRAVDLTGFAIKYYTSHPDTVTSSGMGLILKPRSYAVIFEGDYDISSGVYKNLVPFGALILKIKSNSFGSSGMSNTADRNVSILNAKSDTLDSYSYSANNKEGISDEKINPDGNNSPSNWANSLLQGGTPGYRNSVTPRDFDLSLSAIRISPLYPKHDEAIEVSLTVKNSGIKNAEDCLLEAFLNAGGDSASSEKMLSEKISLQAKDSTLLRFKMPGLPGGSYSITGIVNFPDDEIPVNNKRIFNFSISPVEAKYNDLVINEIMFAPSSGEPEWIELFNPTNSTVNLKNWKAADRVSQCYILQKNFLLKPGGFVVISRDSTLRNHYEIPSEVIKCSLPQLNNDGDAIALYDSTGFIIDSLEFKAPYGMGRSLERIDPWGASLEPSNWKISISPFKATPGKPNSVRRLDSDLELREISLKPGNPFAGSRIALLAKVINTGRSPLDFKLQLFIRKGDSLQTEEKLSESGVLRLNPKDSLTFQFGYSEILLNERVFVVRVISDKDENQANNEFIKQVLPSYPYNTIAVNEIMYMPESPEPEWIEVYNTSLDSVNLKGWSVSDIYSTPSSVTISKKDEYIQPGCFMVISRDSLINSLHKTIPSNVIYSALPPLNNDKDGVIIKDAKGTVIDSILYVTPAGAKSGRSLERKEISKPSANTDNWSFSKSPDKSTPGKINSLTRKEYDVAVEEISTEPREPLSGDNVSIRVTISNPGLKDAESFRVRLYSRSYNSEVYNSIAAAEVPSLKALDTITLNFENLLQGLKRGMYVAAIVSYEVDNDTTNNYLQALVEPGYGRNALLINEVMFAPPIGQSEWLELVNVSGDTLNLKDWKVGQFIPEFSEARITPESVPVYPGEFIIIAKD
ncbi:MAG: lamin tail domain-containing protein, partial [Acidobacteriota bacterium]